MYPNKKLKLEAEIHAVNLANFYGEKLSKLLVEFFTPLVGQKILKKDGSLLEKLIEKLPEFPPIKGNPGQHEHATITTYKDSSKYNLSWYVKVCQPLLPNSCVYRTVCVYVGELDNCVLKSMYESTWKYDYKLEEVISKIKAYEEAQSLADNLKIAVHPFDDFV
jgi:hypothetical protein